MSVDPALLEGVEFFELLGGEDRRALAEVVDLVRLGEGETLFRAGEPGESLYLVRSGEVELSIQDNVGQKITLDTARLGDFFGEIALLDAGPRTATAVALADTELVELDRDDLLLLFRKRCCARASRATPTPRSRSARPSSSARPTGSRGSPAACSSSSSTPSGSARGSPSTSACSASPASPASTPSPSAC
jgi:hypothetical protein